MKANKAPKAAALVPEHPRERQAWVLFQLKLRGESYSSIAEREGVNRTSVRKAMTEPSFTMEHAIAETLELTVQELFPERHDATGRRLHQTRGAHVQRGCKTGAAA